MSHNNPGTDNTVMIQGSKLVNKMWKVAQSEGLHCTGDAITQHKPLSVPLPQCDAVGLFL